MNKLIFENGAMGSMKETLLQTSLETAGILFAEPVIAEDGWRLLVREFLLVPEDAYAIREEDHIELQSNFLMKVVKRSKLTGQSLIFVHTHPWPGSVRASGVDARGEAILMPAIFRRTTHIPHGRVVLGPDGYDAFLYSPDGTTGPMEIWDVGPFVQQIMTEEESSSISERYDRQVKAFGKAGHRKVSKLQVAIVGLGGTGSVVAQQLSHLGVQRFMLVDPDFLEITNLNRVVGSTPLDVGLPKVGIAARTIHCINPDAQVAQIQDSILKNKIARRLSEVDVIFSCTDTQGSRSMINYLSYQYMIPCFDMGVRIDIIDGILNSVVGRVQMIGPGLPCLLCSNLLAADTVRRDFMTEEERRADPYVVGGEIPQPAVISLNSTVASLAINMFLGAVADAPFMARYQIYKADTGTVKRISTKENPECVVCSSRGALGRGNSWSFPGRKE